MTEFLTINNCGTHYHYYVHIYYWADMLMTKCHKYGPFQQQCNGRKM